MTPVSDIVAGMDQTRDSCQNVFNFIIKFFEENKCGPTKDEIREGMSLLYGKQWTKSKTHRALVWLSQRNLIVLVSGGKNNRRMTRIVVPQAEWRFRGHRNIYLRSSITLKNVL